jgi:hypothetical protein
VVWDSLARQYFKRMTFRYAQNFRIGSGLLRGDTWTRVVWFGGAVLGVVQSDACCWLSRSWSGVLR